MSKIDLIYNNVDDFGLITSSEATQLGVSRAELVQQAARGKLLRVARGVYRMPIWPAQPEAPYAIAVKAIGNNAFLFGESVLSLLNLAPVDPRTIWVGTPMRVRKRLGEEVEIITIKNVAPKNILGIPCQPIEDAVLSARKTMGVKRAQKAAKTAAEKGLITSKECTVLLKEIDCQF